MFSTLFNRIRNTALDIKPLVLYHYRMSITKSDKLYHNFFLGFIRLHILFHATQEPIFGLEMIRELESHGYSLSPGTLYPTLHALERDGFLHSEKQIVGGKVRKYYTATPAGQEALGKALEKVRELLGEAGIHSTS
jgi:PadR family transcriptional regulator, regulatory protein PadR